MGIENGGEQTHAGVQGAKIAGQQAPASRPVTFILKANEHQNEPLTPTVQSWA